MSASASHGLLHRLLRIVRLEAALRPESPRGQPVPQLAVTVPSQRSRNHIRISPNPHFELGIDNDYPRTTLPTVSPQVVTESLLYLLPTEAAAAAVTIENDQRMAVAPQKRSQVFYGTSATSAVPVEVSFYIKIDASDTQVHRTSQQTGKHVRHFSVGGEYEQVLDRSRVAQPMTPDANSTSMLGDPCQSRRRGWTSPRTMSVAPWESLAKQSASSREAIRSTNGE